MYRNILIFLIVISPVLIFAQQKSGPAKAIIPNSAIPVQAQYCNKFKFTKVNFNKRIDYSGRGEVLEVECVLENCTDDPMDLYIFIIATYEKVEKTKSSFEIPIPEKDRLRSFVPYPFDMKNFEYIATDFKGTVIKDENGNSKITYKKFLHNPKSGINPYTGRAYHLKETLPIRTEHLSKYRKNFKYFNEVAILVFDTEGNPIFRQLYSLRGKRN